MSRLKIPNDKMSNEVKSDKSQRRMRMYIDDNDAVTDKSNKRKRYVIFRAIESCLIFRSLLC